MIRFRKSLPFPLFKVFLWHLVKIEFWMIFLIHFKKLPINKAFVQKTSWIRKLHLSWGNKSTPAFSHFMCCFYFKRQQKMIYETFIIRKWFMNKSKLWEFHTLSFQISAALLCPPVRHSWNKTENMVIFPKSVSSKELISCTVPLK